MGFLRKGRKVRNGCGALRRARAVARGRARARESDAGAAAEWKGARRVQRGPVDGADACDVLLDRMHEAVAGFGRRDAAGQEGGTRVTRLRAAVRRLPSRVDWFCIATG
ncbi:hypothetical protein [Burkholderia lata]|uniref:hypothetical protein n=1 Tax=Burkholderia lata (strain ATCC 17760 / DSM 23089 / LMG 22485 / NCIMB 9086 / R18194 / 383) TaxID=482957 RepID=UPI001582BA66|nr:hypothetical protein [Burkholderia lata]